MEKDEEVGKQQSDDKANDAKANAVEMRTKGTPVAMRRM
jgi:hypothetical protein